MSDRHAARMGKLTLHMKFKRKHARERESVCGGRGGERGGDNFGKVGVRMCEGKTEMNKKRTDVHWM